MEHISVERTPRSSPRKVSEKVRELHSALAKVLHNEDRAFLIQSLNQYQRDRDVNSLVVALKSVLNTPRKREVYPLLWQIIPHSDQDIFHNLWHRDAEASRQRNLKSPARSPGNLRRVPTSSSLPDNLHRHASDSGIDLPNMTQFQSAEHGVGLYVSSVDEKSVAEKEGVLPGDHVIQVNGTRFDGLTHEQAVKVTKILISLQTMKALFGLMPYSVCHL